jgi:hypothetical protein
MNYPPELDTDNIDELASYIERRYPTEEIRFHDTETIHFGYWDGSTRIVSAMLLDHIQAAGYRILHTGVATVPRRSTRRVDGMSKTRTGRRQHKQEQVRTQRHHDLV